MITYYMLMVGYKYINNWESCKKDHMACLMNNGNDELMVGKNN